MRAGYGFYAKGSQDPDFINIVRILSRIESGSKFY